MKRKLNESDVPQEANLLSETSSTSTKKHKQDEQEKLNTAESSSFQSQIQTFADLQLDARLLQGIVKQKWASPTPVQAKGIPLALEGKDVLARSRTGSGKTGAYVLPILQSILRRRVGSSDQRCTSALILVPTRELAGQVTKVAESLAAFCGGDIRIENLTRKEDDKVQRARLADSPDIVIATPGRASINLNNSSLVLANLAHLVIDEADLVLSYGYDDDLENISKSIPKGVQTFLMSATLRDDLETLKGLFCRDPILLSLDDQNETSSNSISQYVVKCAEDEKFLLLYAIYMLKLIKGKSIVFVGDIDRCYRVKLFLEQFGIRSCVLNSELPVNSRIHVVEEFNKGVYDIIIASDEHEVLGEEASESRKRQKKETADEAQKGESKAKDENQEEDSEDGQPYVADEPEVSSRREKRKKGPKQDKEYGVARGIDFKNVACVLNFDLPTSSKSYTHRIGRTARAGKTGMALSFVVPLDTYRKSKPRSIRITTAEHDEEVLAKIEKSQKNRGLEVKPYHFDMKKLDGFRYRLNDAMRSVTREAIREARVRELRQELIKSEKLKRHFEENPTDLQHLRHDGELRSARVQPHLKHVPDYLLPQGGKKAVVEGPGSFVGFTKDPREGNRIRRARMANRLKGRGKKGHGTGRKDPLKTFTAKGKR